jgi:diaminopimelate decarboxylase
MICYISAISNQQSTNVGARLASPIRACWARQALSLQENDFKERGMDFFEYRGSELYCEGVKVSDICGQVGTPAYIYSYNSLIERYRDLDKALSELDLDHLICFSLKSNSNLAVIRALAKEGAGADIVSAGELYRALKAGVDPKKIVFAGVGKTKDEIQYALEVGILMFNVESMPEAKAISDMAKKLRKTATIALRVNPDVDPHTHHHITTGKKETKFGLGIDVVADLFKAASKLPNLLVNGIHSHIGSLIMSAEPYVESLKKLTLLIKELRRDGIQIQSLNLGGGIGIVYDYDSETPFLPREYAASVAPYVKPLECQFLLEPGRFITGNSGILVTEVIYLKHTLSKTFVIVDAAMNDLVRPVLYDAYHDIKPVKFNSADGEAEVVDVVGPVCESGDFLAKDRKLPKVEPGDLICVFSAGAYGFVMSSNYNSRPRAPEVMVIGDEFFTVRQRESLEDLIRGEFIPEILTSV